MFPFKTALNTSTLFPFRLDVTQQLRIAAEAGFEGIELWMKDIAAYLQAGGTIDALKRSIADAGLTLANAITFFRWADADPQTREQGFAQAEREMRILAELGCRAVAAPPYGDVAGLSLEDIAGHYARLAALAGKIGIETYLEFWGRAPKLAKVSEALFIAVESGVSNAKLLLDPFHMYTGGSAVESLAYLHGANIGIVHVNDYPATPAREQITDRDRVFPGAGIAPTHELARLLDQVGYRGYLSLELFSESYGEQPAIEVAKHGLNAIKTAYMVS
jgi:sugar phosphate isomerase/epimerase